MVAREIEPKQTESPETTPVVDNTLSTISDEQYVTPGTTFVPPTVLQSGCPVCFGCGACDASEISSDQKTERPNFSPFNRQPLTPEQQAMYDAKVREINAGLKKAEAERNKPAPKPLPPPIIPITPIPQPKRENFTNTYQVISTPPAIESKKVTEAAKPRVKHVEEYHPPVDTVPVKNKEDLPPPQYIAEPQIVISRVDTEQKIANPSPIHETILEPQIGIAPVGIEPKNPAPSPAHQSKVEPQIEIPPAPEVGLSPVSDHERVISLQMEADPVEQHKDEILPQVPAIQLALDSFDQTKLVIDVPTADIQTPTPSLEGNTEPSQITDEHDSETITIAEIIPKEDEPNESIQVLIQTLGLLGHQSMDTSIPSEESKIIQPLSSLEEIQSWIKKLIDQPSPENKYQTEKPITIQASLDITPQIQRFLVYATKTKHGDQPLISQEQITYRMYDTYAELKINTTSLEQLYLLLAAYKELYETIKKSLASKKEQTNEEELGKETDPIISLFFGCLQCILYQQSISSIIKSNARSTVFVSPEYTA